MKQSSISLAEALARPAMHMCIDMQNLFSEGPWKTPWMPRVLPKVIDLVGARPKLTSKRRFCSLKIDQGIST